MRLGSEITSPDSSEENVREESRKISSLTGVHVSSVKIQNDVNEEDHIDDTVNHQ